MRRLVFAVPGDLNLPTGGYAYDRRIIAELRDMGWSVEILPLGEGFPKPDAATLRTATDKLCAVANGVPIVVDGLAYGVMPDAGRAVRPAHPLIALVHHPLAFETGVSDDDAERFLRTEREALSHVHHVVVTSRATAALVHQRYHVPEAAITVCVPGVDPAAFAQERNDGVIRLICVGSIVPRKGYDVLISALAKLADLPWTLTIAGARDRDAPAADALDRAIAAHRIGARVTITGPISAEALAACYVNSDVFVLASRFEGYGMAYQEAISHGLPVIGTTAGAIPEVVPPEAGVLVAPDDVDELAQALRTMITDTELRRRYAAGARDCARRLPRWRESARRFAGAVEAVA